MKYNQRLTEGRQGAAPNGEKPASNNAIESTKEEANPVGSKKDDTVMATEQADVKATDASYESS